MERQLSWWLSLVSINVSLLLNKKELLLQVFPRFLHADRKTKIGEMIGEYLTCKSELDDHVIHLLFSANRWEAMYACPHHLNRHSVVIMHSKHALILDLLQSLFASTSGLP